MKSFLIKSFCLSLYGCCLWTLSSPDIHTLVVSLNHILRKVWCLPRNSHSAIGNCLARIPMVNNSLLKRFFSFNSAISSPSPLLRNMFYAASMSPNSNFGHHHARFFTDEDLLYTNIIREIRATFGCVSPVESIVASFCLIFPSLFFSSLSSFFCTLLGVCHYIIINERLGRRLLHRSHKRLDERSR